ncbi:hypothetical protein HYV50_00295 [Candidatus Pacearchaeota archaeon]|nr:hypothetical protein [Candidatus Pacearchaeota archaeon]
MTEGFTVENWKLRLMRKPVEDAFGFDNMSKIMAVADGVTRDPFEDLHNVGTLMGKIDFLLNYPKPSPAKVASNILVETFRIALIDYYELNRNEKAIRKAFDEANKEIRNWNGRNISNADYLTNDFAGCVAAGICRLSDVFSFGYLTDAGIAVFDLLGNLKFRTENQGPDKHDKYIWQDKRLQGIDWRNPEARRIVRRDYRNNPKEEHSFGVLTGEDSAMNYVRTGTQELRGDDILVVYTDGLESTIFSGEFSDLIRRKNIKGIEKLCKKKVRTEGTIVYYHHPSELNYSSRF